MNGTKGTCPVCNRTSFLLKNGTVGFHRAADDRRVTCPGVRQPAQQTFVDPDVAVIEDVIRSFGFASYDWPPLLAAAIATSLKEAAL